MHERTACMYAQVLSVMRQILCPKRDIHDRQLIAWRRCQLVAPIVKFAFTPPEQNRRRDNQPPAWPQPSLPLLPHQAHHQRCAPPSQPADAQRAAAALKVGRGHEPRAHADERQPVRRCAEADEVYVPGRHW